MPAGTPSINDRMQGMQAACVLLQYPDASYGVFFKYRLTNSDSKPSVTFIVDWGDALQGVIYLLCLTRYQHQEWLLYHGDY